MVRNRISYSKIGYRSNCSWLRITNQFSILVHSTNDYPGAIIRSKLYIEKLILGRAKIFSQAIKAL